MRMQRLRRAEGECTAGYLREFFRQAGIEQECSATSTPQQNGKYEQRDGAIFFTHPVEN